MSFNSNVESIENSTSSDVKHSTINKENVQVSSSISHDATNKVALNIGSDSLSLLMDRLSTTHAQLDQYTQQRTQQISVETQNIIKKILDETKEQQRSLLLEAQHKSERYQEQYQNNLQVKVNQFNEEKAQKLADLEKTLNDQQESILTNARHLIDQLQKDANERKMHVFQEAQETTNDRLEQITEQVVNIAQEDSAHRLASTTTTVITTQAVAQGQTQLQQDHSQTYAQAVTHN